MTIFTHSKPSEKKGTTKGFYFGKPDASSEVSKKGQSLPDFFVDFFDVHGKIGNGNFIIAGRKGSGKSAIAQHYQNLADLNSNVFTTIVFPKDIALDKVIQGLPEVDVSLIFEWNILTRLVKLIIDSNLTDYAKHISDLKKFYDRNSGAINIANYKVAEITTKTEVGTDLLKTKYGGILAKYFKEKRLEKAPFYEFIPVLREILQTVLKYEVYKDTTFIIEFDELDIDFKIDRDADKILNLIRIARDYNINYFKDSPFKVLLFIRDDIREHICAADTTKLFGSHEYTINWYKYDDFNRNEESVNLRKFINKRIAANFDVLGIAYNTKDPWSTLFDNSTSNYEGKTTFSYILDYTFYRPRDFINLLSPLDELGYSYPLTKTAVNSLINKLAVLTMGDIEDELSMLYDKVQISSIRQILKKISASRPPITYITLKDIFQEQNIGIENLQLLMDYDLIIASKDGKYLYKYREQKIDEPLGNYEYSIHRCIYVYFNKLK